MKNSKTKKILSILLAVIMVVGMIPATVIPASATDTIENASSVEVDSWFELRDALQSTEVTEVIVPEGVSVKYTFDKTLEKAEDLQICINGRKTLTLFGNVVFTNTVSMDQGLICLWNDTSDLTVQGKGTIKYEMGVEERDGFAELPLYDEGFLFYLAGGNLTIKDSVTVYVHYYYMDYDYMYMCATVGGIRGTVNIQDSCTLVGNTIWGEGINWNIAGGYFAGRSDWNDGKLQQRANIVLKSGNAVISGGTFSQGIKQQGGTLTLEDGAVWVSEKGDYSDSEILTGTPGIAFEPFAIQSPKMPLCQTETDIGTVPQGKSYPIEFSYSLNMQIPIDWGISFEKRLIVAKKNGVYLYNGTNADSHYDLMDLPAGEYYLKEQVTCLKNGESIYSETHVFSVTCGINLLKIDINVPIPDDWNSYVPGQMQTVGASIASGKWYVVGEDGTLTEKDLDKSFISGQTYRYIATVVADEGYILDDNYKVYINNELATKNADGTWHMDFVARKKLVPIIEKDTYFVQDGTTVEIPVDARGEGVTYGWTGVSEGAGGYYTVSDYTDRILKLEIPEGVEGTNVYMVRITDAYGETVWKTITVHITQTGFKEIKPTPTAEQFEAGVTDYGYVFPGEDGSGVPKVYFEAYELSQGFIDEGYTMETSLIDYVDGVKVGEGQEAWEYTTSLPGAHEIVQKIVIKDSEGNVFKEYTYTHKMNVMRGIALLTVAYGTALYGYRVEVYQDGKLASEQINGNDITMDVVAPVGDVKIVVSKNGYKAREYEATIPADGFFSLNTEILRWGDANLDDVLDVQDYQQTINKGLSDNHKLDGSYEQSVMDWCEDGYIDVLDCFYSILCINGNALYSASLEYDEYYTIEGATLSIPVTAEGFGLKYQWTAPEGAPQIVEGTENKDTVQIDVALNKGYLGNTYTYTCKVNDMFFNESILTVDVTVEERGNLYAVTYSSQYDELADQLPGKVYVKKGESITISDTVPEMDGYTFLYWRTGDLQRLSPGDTYKPYQNTVISPYMGKNYTITLHSGYEGELFGTHTGCYGHHYDLPDMDYMPEGYVFYGWTDVEGSTEVKYTKGATYEIKGDADLYPVIAKASDVKLTIYANDGTDQVIYETTLAEQNGALYFTIPEDLEMPTRDGYVCRYFYIDPNYVHGDYHEERLLYPGSEIIAGADGINLYVIWIAEYSVTYDSGTDDENVYVPYPETYAYGDYASVSTDKPYREGYNFLYWEDANGTKYYGNEIIIVESAIVLTAVWEKIDTENYEIWIAGQKVSKANPVVQCGTGTARVVEDEWGYCTIILDGAQITGTEGIRTEYNSIDIEVYGENTITVSGDDARGIIGSNGNISITGPGSLTINATGDGARGIYGLHGVDYTNITVNATPETEDGVTYGVTSSSDLQIHNGAVLTVTGTCGFAIHGIYADSTSRIYATGTRYGFYDISSFMGFGGRIVAKGGISAISTTNSYFESWHPSGMVTSYSTSIDGSNLAIWDGSEKFYDDDYSTSGVKYVEIHPVLCTDGHSPSTFEGLDTGCESDGLTDGEYCSVCGYIITEREYVEATGHDYHTHNGKEPTCTEKGVDGTYTQCDKCGEYQGDVTFIDATGHSWGEWILIDGTDVWYDEYGYGEREYIRYCYNCDEYERTWYSYEDPNDTGSPNDWESGGAGPAG